ncbi:MAG TPA: nucleoside hydrolase [Archangium sp.]|uniref:nucleoside hydrolase n=1 Tax=Archangium sp. TaxID=1872627 RepID=UPI002E320A50|nr:nucleoside hydrolase [Archangium sp.]HEX5749487.1 nucleoside hydrolase [Archangium sp.]
MSTPQTTASRLPVIIDTDVDIDDWMAMLFLLKHPEVDVLGITTTGTGAAHLTPGTLNALKLLMLVDQPTLPVARGANAPLRYSNVFPTSIRSVIDSVYGLPLPTNPNGPSAQDAVSFLRTTLLGSPTPVSILAIGGLTNLGILLRDHPEVAPRIARIVVMGGAVNVPGNVNVVDPDYANKTAEWNIFLDPLGADIVFRSGVPITLVPLDASNHVPLDMNFYVRLQDRHDTRAAAFVFQALTADMPFVNSGDFYFWDPLAAAALVAPSLVTTQQMGIRVVQELNEEEDHSGQLLQDDTRGSRMSVAMGANADAFYELFLSILNLPDGKTLA